MVVKPAFGDESESIYVMRTGSGRIPATTYLGSRSVRLQTSYTPVHALRMIVQLRTE